MSDGDEAPDPLAPFRAQEPSRPELVHPLVTDPDLCNLVVAWSMADVRFEAPGDLPSGEGALWDRLWDGAKWDRDDLANALRTDKMRVGRLVERARRFRLIYPDGRVNQMALTYIRGVIAKSLSKKKGKSGP